MPTFKKGGFKFKRTSKYVKKYLAAKRKKYRNRQQKLSIKTVKTIAKRAALKVQETKYYSVDDYHDDDPHINLGHPQLFTTNTAVGGHPYVFQLFSNQSISRGVGATQRIGDKINLKGFRIKILVNSPPNASTDRLGASWYNFHWLIVQGRRGVSLAGQLQNDVLGNLWDSQVILNRDKTRPKMKVVKKGKYVFRPKTWIICNAPGVPVAPDLHPRPQQTLPSTCSTIHSKFFNLYIPINKSYNMADTSITLQPEPYYLIMYSLQARQKTGTDGYYVNEIADGGMAGFNGNLQYNVRVSGLKWTVLFSD